MKKIVRVALAAVLAFSMLGLLMGCNGGSSDIVSITVGTQQSNDVTISNYEVHLNKDAAAWAGLSDSAREKIAKSGFDESQAKIKEDGKFNYNIIGLTSDGERAFQFDRQNSLVNIYVANEKVAEVAVTVPAAE
jgi:hypothetical protein